jgi:hypothetical protein
VLANPEAFTHNSRKSWRLGGMAMSFRFGSLQPGLLLAAALSVSLWPAAASAYTPEQEQACTGDGSGSAAPKFPTSAA